MKFIEMDPNGVWARSPRWGKAVLALIVLSVFYLVAGTLYSLAMAVS